MSRQASGSGRAARMTSYLLVFMTVSSLCLTALAGSIALRNSGSAFSRLLADLWPGQASTDQPPIGAAAAKPHKPSLLDDPALRTDRQLLRAIAEQLEKLSRRVEDTHAELRQIETRVAHIENEKTGIDWISTITAIVFLIQASAGLVGIFIQLRRGTFRKQAPV